MQKVKVTCKNNFKQKDKKDKNKNKMQLTMEQRIFIVKLYLTKRKGINKFKPRSELCFQNFYHQVKPQFEKLLKNMRDMAHL